MIFDEGKFGTDEYQAGYDAYCAGAPIDNWPHSYTEQQVEDWKLGWNDAAFDD